MANIRITMNGCMETGKKVQVLLSTYNGEKYLRQQLESIVAQTIFPEVSVLIRDDGSDDGTKEILKEYEARYNFEVFYGKNLGISKSYEWLMLHSSRNCAFFALCDQDDLWLPNKLEIACAVLAKHDSNSPLLYVGRSRITDEKLNSIGVSVKPQRISFYNAMVQNVCPGHNQVFSKSLMDYLIRTSIGSAYVVDWWVYLTASGIGEIVFDDRFFTLHRQHGHNAVGYMISPFKQLILRTKRLFGNEASAITKQLKAFYDCCSLSLPVEYRNEIGLFIQSQRSVTTRLQYVRTAKIYRQGKMETLILKGLYVLGKYKIRT